jgi:hypothetical protein
MQTPQSTKAADGPLARDLLDAARHYLGGRRGIFLVAAIAVVIAVGFGWNWLVAAGLAPILLTALPCLLMCGLGLCMNKLVGSSCASEPTGLATAASAGSATTMNVVSIKNAAPGASACRPATPTEQASTQQDSTTPPKETHHA